MQNSLYLSLISAISKGLGGLILLSFLARVFSLSEFGLFTYSLTIATILSLIVDYGYNLKSIKDVAANPSSLGTVLNKAISGKLVLTTATLLIITIVGWSFPNNGNEFFVVFLLFLGLSSFSFMNLFLSGLKGIQNYKLEMILSVIDNALTITVVFLMAFVTKSVLFAALALFASKLISLAITVGLTSKISPIKKPDFRNILNELRETLPFGIHYWVGTLYLSIDTVIMETMVKPEEIGLYQAGIRIVIGSGILLTVVNSVFLPKLADIMSIEPLRQRVKVSNLNALTVRGSLLITIILILFGKLLIRILYGPQFEDLSQIFWIFGLIIGLRIFGAPYGVLLTISERQNVRAAVGFISVLIIAALDLILIPKFGYVSAAYVLLGAHLFINTYYMFTVYKEFGTVFFPHLKQIFYFKIQS